MNKIYIDKMGRRVSASSPKAYFWINDDNRESRLFCLKAIKQELYHHNREREVERGINITRASFGATSAGWIQF